MITEQDLRTLDERVRVGPELQHEVEQFLYYEAELLDERRFRDWLDLMSDNVQYEVRARYNAEETDLEDLPPMIHFADDKESLNWRVKRTETGMDWAEQPPSRTRYLVTNVRVTPTDDGLVVKSNFLLYRNRLEVMAHFLVGERLDWLQPAATDAGFTIERRIATLDQNVILSTNLSMFF